MEPSSSSEIRNSSELTPLLNTERARERLSSDTASSSENFHRRDMENAIQIDRWLREIRRAAQARLTTGAHSGG